MGDKQAARASEEMSDPDFLAKTFMTCLPVTGFDESNTHSAQAEVGGVQQQAREGELLKTARRPQ
jgi:hypothetical protein